MCKQELTRSYAYTDSFLQQSSSTGGGGKHVVDDSCREKIVSWCYRVVDYFGLRRDTVYMAMSYLDRFMSMHSMERYTYKLAATTALLLAIKIHQPRQINLKHTIKDFSNGQFDSDDVIRMELIMLRSLSWKLHPPSPSDFILRLISWHSFSQCRIQEFDLENLKNMAIFFVELSVWDYSLSTKKPSIVATCAILNAIEHLGLLSQVTCGLDPKSENDLNDGNRRRSIIDFVEMLFVTFDLKNCDHVISKARCRLKSLYEQSEEYVNTIKARQKLKQKQIQVASNFASICRVVNNKGIMRQKKKNKKDDYPRVGINFVGSPTVVLKILILFSLHSLAWKEAS